MEIGCQGGTQVKKRFVTAAVHWYLPDYGDLSLKHVGESTMVCNLYYVHMLVYKQEYKHKTQDE
jgi:hypothetical protein